MSENSGMSQNLTALCRMSGGNLIGEICLLLASPAVATPVFSRLLRDAFRRLF